MFCRHVQHARGDSDGHGPYGQHGRLQSQSSITTFTNATARPSTRGHDDGSPDGTSWHIARLALRCIGSQHHGHSRHLTPEHRSCSLPVPSIRGTVASKPYEYIATIIYFNQTLFRSLTITTTTHPNKPHFFVILYFQVFDFSCCYS